MCLSHILCCGIIYAELSVQIQKKLKSVWPDCLQVLDLQRFPWDSVGECWTVHAWKSCPYFTALTPGSKVPKKCLFPSLVPPSAESVTHYLMLDIHSKFSTKEKLLPNQTPIAGKCCAPTEISTGPAELREASDFLCQAGAGQSPAQCPAGASVPELSLPRCSPWSCCAHWAEPGKRCLCPWHVLQQPLHCCCPGKACCLCMETAGEKGYCSEQTHLAKCCGKVLC